MKVFPAVFGRKNRSVSLPRLNSPTKNIDNVKAESHFYAPSTTAGGRSALNLNDSLQSRGTSVPSEFPPKSTKVSHVSRQSTPERGSYRVYTFPDGTVLEVPKNTNDSVCRYRNREYRWETNEFETSDEMYEKLCIVTQSRSSGGSHGSRPVLTNPDYRPGATTASVVSSSFGSLR